MSGGRAGNLILRSPGDFDIVSGQLNIIYLGVGFRCWEYGGTRAVVEESGFDKPGLRYQCT